MSRIGRLPVLIPAGVTAEVSGTTVKVKGPLGALEQSFDKTIGISLDGNHIHVTRSSDEKAEKALHGMTRAIIHNMVLGVTEGFKKSLIVAGVGYKLAISGDKLTMNIGFSHPVEFVAPEGIKLALAAPLEIVVSGTDKHLVGQVAADIKAIKPIEPYHGYGIHYKSEPVVLKVGKKAGK